MEPLPVIDRFLELLWRASWQASVLVLLVLIVQFIWGRRLAPNWRYALWLLVVVRLLAPVTPSSAWSVFNVAKAERFSASGFDRWPLGERSGVSDDVSRAVSSESQGASAPAPIEVAPTEARATPTAPPRSFVQVALDFLRRHLVWIWFLGVLVLAMRLAWGNYLFALQLRKRRRIDNPSVLLLLEECRERIRLRRTLTLIEVPELDSPALFGCFRLKLLLPEKMIERFSSEELRHVFLHELAHVRRCDAAVNWLATILQTLHWFNPLLWFAFHRMRADRELACDALALAYAQDGETKPYGHTVIKVLEGFTQATTIPGLVGILEDKQQIKRRIAMIAQFKKSSGWPVAAVALIALLGCVSLTDSKKDQSILGPASKKTDGSVSLSASASVASGQTIMQKLPVEKFAKWVTDPGTRPSPDGRYLAFINWDFGNLAISDTTTGESRDLTTDGTWDPKEQFCDSIVWSPDGKQIAYVWYKEGEGVDLRIIDRSGGKPRIVVSYDKDDSMEADVWSRDGRYVVGPARRGAGTNKVFRIVRVEVATGAVKVLKDLPAAKGWFRVALSFDDRQIAYDSGTGQLRAINIDGSNDRVLLDNPAGTREPVWTPDGRHLVFRSNRSGTEALWALPMKEGEATGAPILVREGFFHENLWGCSADGTLYWLTQTPRANIFVADVDFAAGTIQTPRQVSLRFDGRSRHPRWSADGSTLSYVSRQFSGTKDAIHVIRETASGKERDVRIPAVYYGGFGGPPQWSADYQTLYARAVLEGNDSGGLYSFDAQTGKPTLISNEGDVGTPNLSPDGGYLIYLKVTLSATNRVREIVERDLRSGRERVVRRSRLIPVGPNPLLSRDGNWLAYLESDGTNALLQIISRADGATKTVWENVPGRRAAVLDWLPDNRRVLISIVEQQGTQQLHLVDTETKSARPFAQPMPEEDRIFQLSIHPDGKRIAFWREHSIKEIWTMKNILPQEKLAAK